MRTIRIAGAQLTCTLGRRDDNLARAEELATEAAAEGARLVLFPELMPSGWELSPRVWQALEPSAGPTVQWLRRTSAHLGVHLGTSFPELDGGHVYNTFVLAGPDGAELGRVRKSHVEVYVFRGRRGPHIIECELGRIGVGICADNTRADFARLMRRAHVDLLLMPHAGPAARSVGGMVSEADVRRQHGLFPALATLYAHALGVPALLANQCGPLPGRGLGILGSLMTPERFHFAGHSALADSDGRLVAGLEDDEGLVIGDVHIDPARRPDVEPRSYGAYVTPGYPLLRYGLYPVDGLLGRLYYATHRRGLADGERSNA